MSPSLRSSLLSVILSTVFVLQANAQTEFLPVGEAYDGPVEDIAGPSVSSEYAADDQRVWLATGRVRAAIRVSDRKRMVDEDRTFSSFDSPRKEKVCVLELNESRGELFTLTDAGIYREDVSDPSNPLPLEELAFDQFEWFVCSPCSLDGFPLIFDESDIKWEMDFDLVDMKIWEGATAFDDRLILMTAKRIIVIQIPPPSSPQGMIVQSYAGELFDSTDHHFIDSTVTPPSGVPDFDDAKLRYLAKLRLAQDGNKVMAYVLTRSRQFNGIRNDAYAIVACDLNADNPLAPWQNPTFNVAPVATPPQMQQYEYRWWQPAWPGPSLGIGTVRQYTVYDFDLYEDSGQRFAIAACGCQQQLQRLDITNAFQQSGQFLSSTTIDGVTSTAGQCGSGTTHLYAVRADPTTPHRYFVGSASEFHVVDDFVVPRVVSTTVDEPTAPNPGLDRTAKRDMLVMYTANELYGESPAPLPPYEIDDWAVWVAAFKAPIDHILKVFDVTSNTHPSPLPLFDERYSMSTSDGAVAIPGSWDIFTPTFGGIVRFHSSDQGVTWKVVDDSFQPAEDESNPVDKVQRNTEHIAIGAFGMQNPHRVFTVSAQGELFRYRVDALSGNPEQAGVFKPELSLSPWGTWSGAAGYGFYSNDVAFIDFDPASSTDGKYALLVITRKKVVAPLAEAEHALLVYEWDDLTDNWEHVDVAVSEGVPPVGGTTMNANSINIAQAHNTTWALIGHQEGFFWVDIGPLATGGSLSDPSDFQCVEYNGNNANVGCVLVLDDPIAGPRLFVSRNAGLNRGRFEIWDWTEPNPTDELDENVDVLNFYTAADLQLDDISSAIRGRFYEYPTPTANGVRGLIHLASDPNFLQLSWPAPVQGGGTDPDTVELQGYWAGDYSSTLQDCRAYDFGTGGSNWHVVVSKDSESFAVIPFDGDPNNP